jgi:hypothetical protein
LRILCAVTDLQQAINQRNRWSVQRGAREGLAGEVSLSNGLF